MPGAWLQCPGHQVDKARLAGPVGPVDRVPGAAFEAEIDRVRHRERAEAFARPSVCSAGGRAVSGSNFQGFIQRPASAAGFDPLSTKRCRASCKSTAFCKFSQNCAVVPTTRAILVAVQAVIAARPFDDRAHMLARDAHGFATWRSKFRAAPDKARPVSRRASSAAAFEPLSWPVARIRTQPKWFRNQIGDSIKPPVKRRCAYFG